MDQRLSQKNFLPRATFSGVIGLSEGTYASCWFSPAGSLSLSWSARDQLPPNTRAAKTTLAMRIFISHARFRRDSSDRGDSKQAGQGHTDPGSDASIHRQCRLRGSRVRWQLV